MSDLDNLLKQLRDGLTDDAAKDNAEMLNQGAIATSEKATQLADLAKTLAGKAKKLAAP
jgi:hypothetical protein